MRRRKGKRKMATIDADKLHLKLLDMEFPIQDQDPILDAMDDCMVDTAPVVHGWWLPYENEQDKGFHYCSVCKGQAFNYEDGSEVVEVLSNYCPNCGAKMGLSDGEA